MSDVENQVELENEAADSAASELEAARNQATLLGITFHPSLGLDKLKQRIAEHLAKSEEPVVETKQATVSNKSAALTRAEAMKLQRVRITCMDPRKNTLEGELFTVGNAVLPSVTKYIPFGVEWHVPAIFLNVIRDAKYMTMVERKNKDTGQKYREPILTPTYAIETLDPLTEEELKDLAQRQAMAGGTAA